MTASSTAVVGATEGLVLYGTSACHLCEIAEQLLGYYHQNIAAVQYRNTDISESDELFERYGLRIPVLRHSDGRELDWPFSVEELTRFFST